MLQTSSTISSGSKFPSVCWTRRLSRRTVCSSSRGQYRLNDDAHARLRHEVTANGFNGASPERRSELGRVLQPSAGPVATKKDAKAWARLQAELQLLREGYTSLAGPRPHRE